MKIKHLVDLFYHKLNGPDDATAEDAMRVVLTALRDETQKFVIDAYSMDRMFSEILAPREGGATTDAIQSFEGDESDGHFSEGISRTERAGKAAVGAPERSGSGTAQHDHDGRENPRDVAGSHETGRGRHVGGQVNHGVSRGGQAAGGSTREDGRATDAGFDSLPADVGPSTPAAPAPVCVWERTAWAKWFPQCDPETSPMFASYRTDIPQKCPLCLNPIKFTEAQR